MVFQDLTETRWQATIAPMCGINCIGSRWTPAIFPEYRPPKRAGWTIQEMPEDFPDPLRKAWSIRKQRVNRNGHEAVEEMVLLLKNNGVEITKEVRAAIENRADFEWCGFEPSRCRHRVKLNAASTMKAPVEIEVKSVVKAVKPKSTPQPSQRRSGCCGGRGVR